jgi:TRAP-type C4-dicarboxylate transport system permease small subunit
MNTNNRLLAFLIGALLAFVLAVTLLYVRQRLFTKSEPIVLAS